MSCRHIRMWISLQTISLLNTFYILFIMDFGINFDVLKYCIRMLFISVSEFLGTP